MRLYRWITRGTDKESVKSSNQYAFSFEPRIFTTAKKIPSGLSRAEVQEADRISGEWSAVFEVEGMKVPVKFVLKLAGEKVTGTVESEHTGPGKLSDGLYSGEKLAFTMVFERHDSILVTGKFVNGKKLGGEFATEGRKGTWTAELAAKPH